MSTTMNTKYIPAAASPNVGAIGSTCRGWSALHFDFHLSRGRLACTNSEHKQDTDCSVMRAPEITGTESSGDTALRIEPHAMQSFIPPGLLGIHDSKPKLDTGLAVFETDRLDRRCIDKLVAKEVLAVRVGGFVPRSQALDIGGQLMDCTPYRSFDDEAPGHLGMPFHEALTHPDLVDVYFEQAQSSIAAVRKCCEPYSSPVDTLRCMLDEIWPAGAHLQSIDGRKMFVGLPNVLQPDVCFQARCNALGHSAHAVQAYGHLQSLLVCNIYLSTPQAGAELLIWEQDSLAPEVLAVLREAEQDVDPILLGKPSLKIKLEPGELILFDARQPYAVNDKKGVPRMNLSLFVGYRGENAPLTYWS